MTIATVFYPDLETQYPKLNMKLLGRLQDLLAKKLSFPISDCPHPNCKGSGFKFATLGQLGAHYRDKHLPDLLEAQKIPSNKEFRVKNRGVTDLMISYDVLQRDHEEESFEEEVDEESSIEEIEVPLLDVASFPVSTESAKRKTTTVSPFLHAYRELSDRCRNGEKYLKWKGAVWEEELKKTGHQEVLCGHCGKYATQVHHANPLEDFNSILMRSLRITAQTDAVTVLKDDELTAKIVDAVGQYHLTRKPRVWFVCAALHDLCTSEIDQWRKGQK